METQYRCYLQSPLDGQWHPYGPPFDFMTAAELWIRRDLLAGQFDYIIKAVRKGETDFSPKS